MRLLLSIFAASLLLTSTLIAEESPKNLILVIGDGMGPQQISLAALYNRKVLNPDDSGFVLGKLMDEGEIGVVDPSPLNGLVTDSACAATQLSAGVDSLVGTLGIDSSGNPVETVLERAKRHGKSVGLVSDTRLTHATPAGFAAHVASRGLENLIAEQMLTSGTDVMLSGGTRHFVGRAGSQENIPFSVSSKRIDNRDLLQEAKEAGYALAFSKEELQEKVDHSSRVLGLFAESAMLDGIKYRRLRRSKHRKQPSLLEMAESAIQILSRNPNGFFLMIEAGQIDWAGHANDVGWLLAEMHKLDEMLRFVDRWSKQNEDTLLVITADHETGSFGMSYSAHDLPQRPSARGGVFQAQTGGLYQPGYNFGYTAQLESIAKQRALFSDIFRDYENLSFWRRGVSTFQSMVESAVGLSISRSQARRILAKDVNPYYLPGHKYLGNFFAADVGPYAAFYPYPSNAQTTLLARELAARQGIVWGTGTHTATPVYVIARGPTQSQFGGFLHATQVGKRMLHTMDPSPSDR